VSNLLSIDEKCALGLGISARRIVHEMPWLTRPLVATEAARARLATWLGSGGLDRARRTAHEIRATLAFFGDIEMLPAVVAAFERMAPPACDYVMGKAFIIGVGATTDGWTSAAEFPRTHRQIIALNGARPDFEQLRKTTAHEAAHVWLEEEVPIVLSHEKHRANLREACRADGTLQVFEGYIEAVEARARELAACWNANAFEPRVCSEDAHIRGTNL
jgi:hypothetical protein